MSRCQVRFFTLGSSAGRAGGMVRPHSRWDSDDCGSHLLESGEGEFTERRSQREDLAGTREVLSLSMSRPQGDKE